MQTICLWGATILSFFGYYFLNRKNVWGMWIFMVVNLCTGTYDVLTHNWVQLLMVFIMTGFNIDGIRRWSQNEKKPEVIKNEPV